MRVALFKKLDRLAPAYLVRRRTGDLVSMSTQDVETVEFFFAHTVAPGARRSVGAGCGTGHAGFVRLAEWRPR